MRCNILLCDSFLRSAEKVTKLYDKSKSDIFDFLNYLSENPERGDAIIGYAGKVRKDRWQLKSYGIGKRGGLRIYYYFHGGFLVPFYIYTKKQLSDAPSELIAQLVTDIENNLTPST